MKKMTKKLPDSNWDNEKKFGFIPFNFQSADFFLTIAKRKNAQLFTAQLWIISYIIHFIADFGLYLKKEFIKSLNRKVVCIEEHFTGERIQKTKKNMNKIAIYRKRIIYFAVHFLSIGHLGNQYKCALTQNCVCQDANTMSEEFKGKQSRA